MGKRLEGGLVTAHSYHVGVDAAPASASLAEVGNLGGLRAERVVRQPTDFKWGDHRLTELKNSGPLEKKEQGTIKNEEEKRQIRRVRYAPRKEMVPMSV